MTNHTVAENHGEMNTLRVRPWHSCSVSVLQELWNDHGLSGDQIGARYGVSRNTVLGRIYRMRQQGYVFAARNDATVVSATKTRGHRIAKAKRQTIERQPKAPGTRIPKLPQLVVPRRAVADLDSLLDPIEVPQRTLAKPLPPMTEARVVARRELEMRLETERRYGGDLRCVCGRPGTPHCDKHRAVLHREGAL